MNWFALYLFLKLDSLGTLFTIITVASTIAFLAYVVAYALWGEDTYGEDKKKSIERRDIFYAKHWHKKTVISILFIFLFLAVFTPTTKQFAVLYLLPKIVNSTEVQQIPNKALGILSKKLDEWASDLQGKEKSN